MKKLMKKNLFIKYIQKVVSKNEFYYFVANNFSNDQKSTTNSITIPSLFLLNATFINGQKFINSPLKLCIEKKETFFQNRSIPQNSIVLGTARNMYFYNNIKNVKFYFNTLNTQYLVIRHIFFIFNFFLKIKQETYTNTTSTSSV